MTQTKKQHYVPQFLLKNFCFDNKQHLFVYDKTQNKSFSSNTQNVAQENCFYNLDTANGKICLEETYAKLEANVAPLITKIIQTESISWLTNDDMWNILEFIIVQFYRTPQYINLLKHEMQTNPEQRIEILDKDTNNILKIIKTMDLKVDANLAKIMAHNTLREVLNNNELIEHFNDMDWLLFRAPNDTPFVTSDAGIAMTNHIFFGRNDISGFELPYTKIFLPISSHLMLALWHKNNMEEHKKIITQLMMSGIPIEVSDGFKNSITGEATNYPAKNVKECNSLFYKTAERFIFSSFEIKPNDY